MAQMNFGGNRYLCRLKSIRKADERANKETTASD